MSYTFLVKYYHMGPLSWDYVVQEISVNIVNYINT